MAVQDTIVTHLQNKYICEVLLHNQLCKQRHIQQYKFKTKQTVPEYANLSILIQRILI
jgi:hypothetical protein